MYKMFDLEKLNAIAIPDDTWRKEAEYRRDNSERLREEAKRKLIELRRAKNNVGN